jgi:hypothetical protein
MKGILLLAAACCCVCAPAQNPMEPQGFPQNLPKDERLPPPLPPESSSYELKLVKPSKEWVVEGNQVHGKDVQFTYRGYLISGDEVEGDLDTNQFVLRGNVDILGQDHVVHGEYVFIDFRARSFRFVNGDADLKKELLKGRLLSDLYIRAKEVSGDKSLITATGASVTTCEYPDPHYTLEAERLKLIPDKRLIFENFRLRILNRTILGIPSVVIPLDRRTSNITPQVGNSFDEGYYVKTRIGVPVGRDALYTRVDLMSKKGLGLGLDYDFGRSNQQGEFRIYSNVLGSSGPPGVTASASYRNDFEWGKFELFQDYRRFFFETGENTVSTQSRLSFAPKQGRNADTLFSFTANGTKAGDFSADNQNLGVSDVRQWSGRMKTAIALNLATSTAEQGGQNLVKNQALDARLQSSYDLTKVVAELDYERNIPIGSNFNFFGGVDRTPELTLSTDARRLMGEKKIKWMPNFTALFSAGHFDDRFALSDVSRYLFDFHASKPANPTARFSLMYDAGFRQALYSDDTAQYTPSLNLLLTARPSRKFSANLRYNYTRQHGFSPLSFDRTGDYNMASFDATGELFHAFTLGGQVGFDFKDRSFSNSSWITPSIRMEYQPSDRLRIRGLANYLPEESSWGNLRADIAWKYGDTFFGAATRYDSLRHKLGNLNLFIDGLKWGRLKLSTLLLYNGYLQKFDSTHISLTYDLHCAEAVLQVLDNNVGFRPGREVLFFIRLKGLPFDSPFGIGRSGEPIGFGTGSGW